MRRTGPIAALLFGSGLCALIYQTVWLRELRLVFGASTMASAAVLAIFMGGLGFGGLVLGRRVDRLARPLRFYAGLEFAIAGTAALTPLLIELAAGIYLRLGGSYVLGLGPATALRVVLAAVVLGATTFLMGGTLPAASRAATREGDVGRRSLAVLYGLNTLGGVTGVLLPTFLLFEHLGIRPTLWLACAVNAVVAGVAWRLGGAPAVADAPVRSAAPVSRTVPDIGTGVHPPAGFVLFAAAAVGFAFLVMELVWYRMLTPLLGGSTYTFGLILAVVLLGIGAGGIAYALVGRRRPASLVGLAVTCGVEALAFVWPLAAGDRIAVWTVLGQPADTEGFAARVMSWAVITALVVLPGSLVAGFQFPLLIGLLGSGRRAVGRHVGLGYAWNTVGAIAGSLVGGFGLMTALTAPGVWRAAVVLLVGLGAAAALLALHGATPRRRWGLAGVAAMLAVTAVLAGRPGPTAAWRHAPIGAGRLRLEDTSPNGIRAFRNEFRRNTIWEADGRESSVALQATFGLSFIINGKSDGNARLDAPTQVMYGLLGAFLHPAPRNALVIGLGTGSTAGWLAAVPTIERVDVAELEPAILEVARACEPVNRNVLDDPRVEVFLGDGREMLLTARDRYDLIASEPSNPYRAGIASLFTREFYFAVRDRLEPGGLFLQWVQAYEVDVRTVRTITATLASVFPRVETWQTAVGDLLLVCSDGPRQLDAAALRARLRQEPYRTAVADSWRATDLEGVLARFVADAEYARRVAVEEGDALNTDGMPRVEFGFARSLGRTGRPLIDELRADAAARGQGRPVGIRGAIDHDLIAIRRLSLATLEDEVAPATAGPAGELRQRAQAHAAWLAGDLAEVRRLWAAAGLGEPADPVETVILGEALADVGDPRSDPLIARIADHDPLEARIVAARLAWRRGDPAVAAANLQAAFEGYRTDPWPWPVLMGRALGLAEELVRADPRQAARLLPALLEPFAVRLHDHQRLATAIEIAKPLGPAAIVEVFLRLEPHFIWNEGMLAARAEFYREAGRPEAARAAAELAAFRRQQAR